jgi:hypothetical protein
MKLIHLKLFFICCLSLCYFASFSQDTGNEMAQDIHITVYHVTAKAVLSQALNFGAPQLTSEINMKFLNHGTYFISLSSEQETSRTIRIRKE